MGPGERTARERLHVRFASVSPSKRNRTKTSPALNADLAMEDGNEKEGSGLYVIVKYPGLARTDGPVTMISPWEKIWRRI